MRDFFFLTQIDDNKFTPKSFINQNYLKKRHVQLRPFAATYLFDNGWILTQCKRYLLKQGRHQLHCSIQNTHTHSEVEHIQVEQLNNFVSVKCYLQNIQISFQITNFFFFFRFYISCLFYQSALSIWPLNSSGIATTNLPRKTIA